MTDHWDLRAGDDEQAKDLVTRRLVAHNQAQSVIIRERFAPEHVRPEPLAVYAYQGDRLVGGCTGSVVEVWRWLTVDLMWVDPEVRGRGLGTMLLTAVEQHARERGCSWAKLNTWDFQAPAFYEYLGYTEYGREVDYPPGHTNFLMRKELR